jgi:hypothetical protein
MADIYIGNVKGPQGATGATGAQGPQGDAATIEVGTVSTTAYGNTAQVINTGTSSEAVFDFVIPQGRPGEETTRMSALTLDTVTAQSAQYPIPATGDTGAVVFGKIIKFFNDIKTAVNSKVNIADIVDGFTSTAANKPLSAGAGKTLNDTIGNLGKFTRAAVCTNTTAVTSTITDWSGYKYLFIASIYSSQTLDCKLIPIALITADEQFRTVFVGSALGSSKRYAKVNISATMDTFTCAIFESLTSVRIYGVR